MDKAAYSPTDEDHRIGSRFIGVIDLKRGLAVHGVGGTRDQYLPVGTFQAPGRSTIPIEGDVHRLIDAFQCVGIQSLYVADLDGIEDDCWQQSLVEGIVDRASQSHRSAQSGTLLLDLGFHAGIARQRWDWIETLASKNQHVIVILATECAADVSVLSELLTRVPRDQIAVSFDYNDGRWLSGSTPEDDWFDVCRDAEVSTVVGLDLACVGSTSVQRTIELCRRIRSQLPQPRYVTGGGIRSTADAQRLLDAGADQLLVASLYAA